MFTIEGLLGWAALIFILGMPFWGTLFYHGFNFSETNPDNNFLENSFLNDVISQYILFGIPIISYILIYLVNSNYSNKTPLGAIFWWSCLTASGYTTFFYRGS